MIDTEDDTDFFRALKLLVLNLGGSLNNVVGCFGLWLLFFIKINFVLSVAEFTFPDLLFISFGVFGFLNFTVYIEKSLALFTSNWVTCGNLSFISKCFKLNFKDIGVNFLSILPSLLVLLFRFDDLSKVLGLFLII